MKKSIKKYILFSLFFVLAYPSVSNAKDGFFYSSFTPNDKYYNRQWYLSKIHAQKAWDKIINKKEPIIAIIDSGVQIDHPDLQENIWRNIDEIDGNGIDDDHNGYIDDVNGWDFVNDLNDPRPKFSYDFIEEEIVHGTIVAGIAAAKGNNEEGVAGLAWNVKIMPLLVLDSRGVGDVRAVIKAIDYAIDNEADIINLSFAGENYNAKFEAAIRRAYKAGILVVAAAGNNNEEEKGRNLDKYPMYPVCTDGYYGENMVLGVAATDALDQKTSFSGYGAKCIDISAPGVSIFNTSLFSPRSKDGKNILNKYYDGYWSGTSMAAPLVSAAAAMIISTNPSLNRQEVTNILLGSSDYLEKLNPEFFGMLGSGRLNVGRAVAMANELLRIKNIKIINSPFSSTSSNIVISDIDGSNKKKYNVLGDFVGGVNVTVGDLNNDNINEIVVGAGLNGGPQVQIFSQNNELLSQFFAYDEKFRGGVNVAVGDINGDGLDDIITGAGPGGGPQVRIFTKKGELIGQFFAYDEKFRGGVNVAVGDINGGLRKYGEIITSPAGLGGPHIRVFNHYGVAVSDFFAYNQKYRGRIDITAGDIDRDGIDEIVCGAGAGGTSHVRIFESDGTLLKAYLAYDNNFKGGVNVAVLSY